MMVTSAPRPTAILAALRPTTPPPITATLAGSTPGTPPSSTPRPPLAFCSAVAPAWMASLPATSDIGGKQRQAAARVGHRLVGDGRDARRDQALSSVPDRVRGGDRCRGSGLRAAAPIPMAAAP